MDIEIVIDEYIKHHHKTHHCGQKTGLKMSYPKFGTAYYEIIM